MLTQSQVDALKANIKKPAADTSTMTKKVDTANASFLDRWTMTSSTLGKVAVAPVSGAAEQLSGSLVNVTSDIGDSLVNLGKGAGSTARETLYGAGEGLNYFGNVGLGGGIGGGLKGVFTGAGEGAGSALEDIGTGAGKGLNNALFGALPALLLGLGIVVLYAVAKRV